MKPTSRRAVLGALAAVPVAAVPALAAATSNIEKRVEIRPADDDLIALEREIMSAVREAEISGPAAHRAEMALWAWERRNPKPEDEELLSLWKTKKDATKREYGFEEVAAKWSSDASLVGHLEDELVDTPAMTMVGIRVKRRIAQYKSPENTVGFNEEGEISASIRRDIRLQRKLAVAS